MFQASLLLMPGVPGQELHLQGLHLHMTNVTESCQGKNEGILDSKLLNLHFIHQSCDKAQPSLNNDNTVPTEIVYTNLKVTDNKPFEYDTSDLDKSLQMQEVTVGDFSREEVIPLYIWANKNSSKDYTTCINQNGDKFGYIPLTDLKLYYGSEVIWKETLPFYRHTNESGKVGCQIF